jgi:hypothetical protein
VVELLRIELWCRNGDGRLIHEIERYVIGICRFGEAAALGETDFNRALAEARQEPSQKSLRRA